MKTKFSELKDQDQFHVLGVLDVDSELVWSKHAGRVCNAVSEDGEWVAFDGDVTVTTLE